MITTNNKCESLPLVIGFFDGIHKGHIRLFTGLKRNKFTILTFTNVPSKKNKTIYGDANRFTLLNSLSPARIIVMDLQKNNVKPKTFINYLKSDINPSIVIIGEDFRFGKKRKGDVKLLAKSFKTKIVKVDGRFKTSIVKSALMDGNIPQVNTILLSPYIIDGIVQHGKHLGRTLGVRTANISLNQNTIAPKSGSYSGYTYVSGKKYLSAVFIDNHLLETHLFNFNKNIYGQQIKIELNKFYEPNEKVKDLIQLKKVIKRKVSGIKSTFSSKLS